MRCPFAYDDAGYVLGALPPDERREFVNHLPGCGECRASVRDLAGLPGLLARVEPSDVEALDGPVEPAPTTLLPRLLHAAQADQLRARRRRYVTLATAACLLVLALVSVPLAIVGLGDRNAAPPIAQSTERPGTTLQMQPLASTVPVQATVGLTEKKWGTTVTLRCAYEKEEYPTHKQRYALFAVLRSGHDELLGSWTVGPGDQIVTQAATSYPKSEMKALEIRRTDGKAVLRTNL